MLLRHAPELLDFGRTQLAALSDCESSDLKISKACAAELQYRMPYRLEHAAYLAVFAFMNHYFR